ncbi:MAG: hypothetical protein PPHEMADM_4928, partial [uncultured Paraburkholderia sp.]
SWRTPCCSRLALPLRATPSAATRASEKPTPVRFSLVHRTDASAVAHLSRVVCHLVDGLDGIQHDQVLRCLVENANRGSRDGEKCHVGNIGRAVFLAILFFGAWRLRAGSPAAVNGTVAGASVGSAAASASALSSTAAAEPRPDRLELRGVGVRVDVWAQTDLWQFLKGQKDAYRSVLSNNPKDYPSDRALVQDKTSGALGSSFKYSAGEGVERWPIPVIIFGPPRSEGRKTNIGSFITTNRQEASLSQHILLSAQTVNVDNPQAQIRLFVRFLRPESDRSRGADLWHGRLGCS